MTQPSDVGKYAMRGAFENKQLVNILFEKTSRANTGTVSIWVAHPQRDLYPLSNHGRGQGSSPKKEGSLPNPSPSASMVGRRMVSRETTSKRPV